MTVTAYYPDVFVKDLEAALAEFESIGLFDKAIEAYNKLNT